MKVKNLDTVQCHIQFGKFIKDSREMRGLTQVELSKQAGITQSYLSYIELGKRDIDLGLAIILCDILNVDLKYFLKNYI